MIETTVKERPIIFSAESARAILAGEKTMTRRIVKPQQSTPRVPPLEMEPYIYNGEQELDDDGLPCWIGRHPDYPTGEKWFSCPYGGVGWRLWGRETWRIEARQLQRNGPMSYLIDYRADPGSPTLTLIGHPDAGRYSDGETRYRSPIHMPRWASRLTLEIESVRVERLRSISEVDALAEGCGSEVCARCDESGESEGDVCEDCAGEGRFSCSQVFRTQWDFINGKKHPWSSDPYMWVVAFRRI